MMRINSDFLKKENLTIDVQNAENRNEFENLIKSFIFNQVISKSFSYLKNKKSELSTEKNLKLIEFIKKYCLKKSNSTNFEFEDEIVNNNLCIKLDSIQNELLKNNNNQKVLETQINRNKPLLNSNCNDNLKNLVNLHSFNNLNPKLNNPIISQISNLPIINNYSIQAVPNSSFDKGFISKINTSPLLKNVNNNNIILNNQNSMINSYYNNFPNNNANFLLGNKTLRNNSYVNNCELNNNTINLPENHLGAYNLIIYQNKLISELLCMFNNVRSSMSNNIPCIYPF